MALDQARCNELLAYVHGGGAPPTVTAPTRVRIMTVNGTSTTNGTEVVTGGGYTSGAGAPSVTWAAPAAGSQATNAIVSITNYPRAETVVGAEIWDSTPKRIEWGALSASKTMAAGDTLSFASAAISSALS